MAVSKWRASSISKDDKLTGEVTVEPEKIYAVVVTMAYVDVFVVVATTDLVDAYEVVVVVKVRLSVDVVTSGNSVQTTGVVEVATDAISRTVE